MKSSSLAECFADVLLSRLRECGQMGSFGRLWVYRFRKQKVGKLVKTSGAFFVGKYQVIEVISSGNLLWQMFWSGSFQYNFF